MNDVPCNLCHEAFTPRGIGRHLKSCLEKHAGRDSPRGVRLRVHGRYSPEYWLHLLAAPGATLLDLDRFLRDYWLECCGHLSSFEIDNEWYEPHAGQFDDLWGDRRQGADVAIARVARPGLRFGYTYDFGSSTHLVLTCLGPAPMPADAAHKRWRDDPIVLLASNPEPDLRCQECEARAEHICLLCPWEETGLLCSACAEEHECGGDSLAPVVNSPRMGVCAYGW